MRVQAPGFQTWQSEVEVVLGERQSLNVVLSKSQPAKLEVSRRRSKRSSKDDDRDDDTSEPPADAPAAVPKIDRGDTGFKKIGRDDAGFKKLGTDDSGIKKLK